MDIKKRLFRRPLTTTLWIAVLTAMAMLLGIGANLLHSADSLLGIIDEHHTTIAVQTLDSELTAMGNYHNLGVTLKRDEIEALSELDTVEKIDLRTLTGAYIPELTAELAVMKWGVVGQAYYDWAQSETVINESYNEMIFTGEVEYCWLQKFNDPYYYDMSRLGGSENMEESRVHAIVKIDKILVGHPDFVFYPTDEEYLYYSGRVHVDAFVYTDRDEPCFEAGEKYIFSGSYDPMLYVLVEEVDQGFTERYGTDVSFPTVSLGSRYSTPSSTNQSSECLIQDDQMFLYKEVIWREDSYPFLGLHGTAPVVVAQKLTTSVAELVASEPLWAESLDKFDAALHTFPVLGSEALETMFVFNRNDATIIDGRMFTREEYDAGDKVCIISEAVAVEAGIEVGDTLHLSQYICARSEEEGNRSLGYRYAASVSLNNPGVGRIPFPKGFETQDEPFTVVGIYKLHRTWDSSAFSITPNTVFIPQKAQIEGGYGGPSYTVFGNGVWEYGETYPNGTYGVYLSVQIKNGQADAFLKQADETANNNFRVFDQGYEAMEESVHQVAVDAWKLIGIASVGWLLLLALYVLLYQDKERSNLGILRSVGGTPSQGRRYLFSSGLLIACVGILAGTLFSSTATRLVSSHLAEFMVSEGTMQAMSGGMELGAETMADILSRASLPPATLLLLTAVQLAVIALTLWLHAHAISRRSPRELLSKS